MKFSAVIASFSMLITISKYKGSGNYDGILNWIDDLNLRDEYGFKSEFVDIVEKAMDLKMSNPTS